MKQMLLLLLLTAFIPSHAHAASVQLPASGQATCYDAAGAVITCAGTGQDGAIQGGVAWNEATRFTDNGNGTITDTLTGLIWLKNANCTDTVGGIAKSNGYLTWENALTWSNNLASGKCGLSDGSNSGQWRLPTRKELKSLVNRGQANNATWLGTKGFSAVLQDYGYWSSSTSKTYSTYTYGAWHVYMGSGGVVSDFKTYNRYVWPVRGGQ
jgi:hypothetical protein